MIDAFAIASSQPWAIEPAALHTVLQVAARMGEGPQALATRLGRPLENTRRVELRGDVAIIPVTGPIFRHAGLLTEVSGATATGTLALDFQSAIENPSIRTIVFDIDSPGGEATGINELANQIYAARGRKTIKAYIGGMGTSAAYWIASATSQVIVDETALLGSIGVVSTYTDTSQRDEKAGIRRVDIVSSASPNKRLSPTTETGRAQIQAVVDQFGEVFVHAVARNRGVSGQRVASDFGQGGVIVGADAIRAGMADGLGSLEGVIAGAAPTQPARGSTATRSGPPSAALTRAQSASLPKAEPTLSFSLAALFERRRAATAVASGKGALPDSTRHAPAPTLFERRRVATRGHFDPPAQPMQPKHASMNCPAVACAHASPKSIFERRKAAVAESVRSAAIAGPMAAKRADRFPPVSAQEIFERRKAEHSPF